MYRTGAALTLTALAALLPARPLAANDNPGVKDLLAFEASLQQIIKQAEPSIACILVSRSEKYQELLGDTPPADRPGELGGVRIPPGLQQERRIQRLQMADPGNVPESYGSGVVIDDRGLVLTNYHVIRDARKIYVRLPEGKGSYANIHAADSRSDLAVLRLLDPPNPPVRAIRFGDGRAVRKGQIVVALANPFAAGFRDGSPSASWGIISNLRRRAPSRGNEDEPNGTARREYTVHHYGTLIQTDARIQAGCSGGALLNLQGEMIGMTTAMAALWGSEAAGGYAIPMEPGIVRIIEDKLKKGEEVEYGFLGITPGPVSGRGAGVEVDAVVAGSPAARAGLTKGHVILAVDGVPLREVDDLFLHVGMRLAGTEVRLDVRTESGVKTARVKLAKFYVPGRIIAANRVTPVRGMRVDYVSVLQQKNPQLTVNNRFASTTSQGGVFICEVLSDSPAMRARLRENDVITHVNDVAVNSPAEFYQIMNDINRKHGQSAPVELTVLNPDWHKPVDKVKVE
jgi:serine protease Do